MIKLQIHLFTVPIIALFQSSSRVLKDVSNSVQPAKSKRHRLFPSSSSQVLDVTTDNVRPPPIGNIENVHLTGRKNCQKTSSLTETRSVVEKVPNKRKVRSRPIQKTAVSTRRSENEFQQPHQPSRSQSSLEPGKRKVVGYIAMTQERVYNLPRHQYLPKYPKKNLFLAKISRKMSGRV